MRKPILLLLLVCLLAVGPAVPARAAPQLLQTATADEALMVASNWINLMITYQGDWGGAPAASVEKVLELRRGEHVLGYFVPVLPQGFVVISRYKELAPVKVYSALSDLDPQAEGGLADLIKDSLERILMAVEQQVGPVNGAQVQAVQANLEIQYSAAWDVLLTDADLFAAQLAAVDRAANYQAGQILLSSSWHQNPPYNDACPVMGCSNSNGRAVVGCVATAGAQIMRYWNWPPWGAESPYNDRYDWPNMRDRVTTTSPQAQIDAVAELSQEIGLAVDMDYGCDGSGADTDDMEEDVYEDHFRYSDACTKEDRDDYGAVEWFNRLKAQFNANRPVQYRIIEHSIVGDGWQEIRVGAVLVRQYHMNYGWDNSYTAWYTLDELHLGGEDDEYVLENIYPTTSLGPSLAGVYSGNLWFPYRYFDRDAVGASATFQPRNYLQFLPGVIVHSTANGVIRFESGSSLLADTKLFTRGDESRGIHLASGTIQLINGGGLVLH